MLYKFVTWKLIFRLCFVFTINLQKILYNFLNLYHSIKLTVLTKNAVIFMYINTVTALHPCTTNAMYAMARYVYIF